MSWRLGILIAGSLEWRNEPYRVAWRKSRLTSDAGVPVKVPIRYGRLSRSNTYTMVFAPGCPEGQAKVRLCARPVSSIASLVEEARALWTAERPADSQPLPGRLHSANWGCVALLANPGAAASQQILAQWAEQVASEKDERNHSTYDSKLYAMNGLSAVSDGGLLQIPWPMTADNNTALSSCDFLIATATRPTLARATADFPTARAVAEAWNKAGNAEYFHANRSHGLHTFQDAEIQAYLRV